jgi:hypothetical protein
LRQRNYQRYKWWEPCAIQAQGYYYDAPDDSYLDKISGENHDVSVKVYGIDGGFAFHSDLTNQSACIVFLTDLTRD